METTVSTGRRQKKSNNDFSATYLGSLRILCCRLGLWRDAVLNQPNPHRVLLDPERIGSSQSRDTHRSASTFSKAPSFLFTIFAALGVGVERGWEERSWWSSPRKLFFAIDKRAAGSSRKLSPPLAKTKHYRRQSIEMGTINTRGRKIPRYMHLISL